MNMETLELIKAESIAFTGHRDIPVSQMEGVRERLKAAISHAYKHGKHNFYCGMALGFDRLAAEAIISLKEELLHVRLVAVVPFRGQSNRWSAIEQRRYRLLLAQADKVVVLSEHYYQGCLLRRNDYMLAHSCGVIAYFDGKPKGGTYYTCGKARDKGMEVVNLYEIGD